MAASVNKVFLIGRCGRDPEIKTFNNGGKIVAFSLATDKTWRDKASGERKQEVTWHNVVIRDVRIMETAERYVRKGSHLCIEGEISNRTYEKDGMTHRISEVVLQPFQGVLTLLSDPPASPRQESFIPPQEPLRTDARGNPLYQVEDDKAVPF